MHRDNFGKKDRITIREVCGTSRRDVGFRLALDDTDVRPISQPLRACLYVCGPLAI